MIVVFFLAPFLISRIGEVHYGLYLLLMSVSGFLGVLDLGLGEATLRFVAYYYGKRDFNGAERVLRATISIYLVMGMAAASFLFFGSNRIAALFKFSPQDMILAASLLKITAFSFLFRFCSGPYLAVPQALLRYDINARVLMLESILRVAGAVTVVLLGYGVTGLIGWNMALSLFTLTVYSIIARRILPGIRITPSVSPGALREIFNYGVFAFLSQIFGIIWQHADRMLLGILVGSGAVAYFAVPQDLAFRIMTLAGSAAAVLMPRFSSMEETGSREKLFLRSSSLLVCITSMLFVPLTAVLTDFMKLWISEEFTIQSGFVGTLIAGSCIVRGAFLPYQSLFRGMGKPQYYLILVICTSMTIVLADLILIPMYGLAGAGYSFCISPLWGFAAILFTWYSLFKKNQFRPLLRFIFVPIFLSFLMLGISFWMRTWFPENLSWPGLILVGGILFTLNTTVIVGYELISGKEQSSIRMLADRLKRFTGWGKGSS